MTHFSDRKINELLEGRIRAGDFPSAVYLVGFEGEPVFLDAHGKAVVRPESILATPSTIYDIARGDIDRPRRVRDRIGLERRAA